MEQIRKFHTEDEVWKIIQNDPDTSEKFLGLPESVQQIIMDFYLGKKGLPVTFDTVFKYVFRAESHPERLAALISAVLGEPVQILQVLPQGRARRNEKGRTNVLLFSGYADEGV